MKIIGIVGLARSGKDTVARLIEKENSSKYNIVIVQFADSLRKFTGDFMDLPAIYCEDNLFKSTMYKTTFYTKEDRQHEALHSIQTGRQILQKIGTIGRSVFGDDVWINVVLNKIKQLRQIEQEQLANDPTALETLVIVSDCRFKNEILSLRELPSVKILRVYDPTLDSEKLKLKFEDLNKHESELFAFELYQNINSNLIDLSVTNEIHTSKWRDSERYEQELNLKIQISKLSK